MSFVFKSIVKTVFTIGFVFVWPILAHDRVLSNQMLYTGEGLVAGLGAGIFHPEGEECNYIGIWQAHVDYFYHPLFSVGMGFRFYGGNIDSKSMLLYQRYSIQSLYFAVLTPRFLLALGPEVGFENTNLKKIQKRISNDLHDEVSKDSLDCMCTAAYTLGDFSIGLNMSSSFVLNQSFSFLYSFLYEYDFTRVHYRTYTVGLAFNIRNYWKKLEHSMLSSWISLELKVERFSKNLAAETLLLGWSFGL